MQTKYNISLDATGSIIALPYLVFFVLAVPLGVCFDKFGYRLNTMIFGFVLLMISQILFLQTGACKDGQVCYEGVFPVILMGITFVIVQLSLYSGIQFIVPEKNWGTAYGLL
jgi:MFS family permease